MICGDIIRAFWERIRYWDTTHQEATIWSIQRHIWDKRRGLRSKLHYSLIWRRTRTFDWYQNQWP